MDMWKRDGVERQSMYLNICVCSCTCVSMCVPVYLYVCVCMDSRQDDWRAAEGGRGGGSGSQSNLCPLPTPASNSSLTGITNMTPGHATLATVPELSSSISRRLKNREQLNTDYYTEYRPYSHGPATVDNSKWASVFGHVGVRERERQLAHC